MLIEDSVLKQKMKEPIIQGVCSKCKFWDSKEYKIGLRGCLKKINSEGRFTMVCRSDDFCKSFVQREGGL